MKRFNVIIISSKENKQINKKSNLLMSLNVHSHTQTKNKKLRNFFKNYLINS